MLQNTFLLKIQPKAQKNLKSTSICSDDHGGFVTPSDHCAVDLFHKFLFFNRAYIERQNSYSVLSRESARVDPPPFA